MKAATALVVGLTVLGTHFNTFAATLYWTGAGGNSDFYTATNWAPVGVPLAGDTLYITNGTVGAVPPFTSSGQVNWTAGTISGLNIASGGVLTVSGVDLKQLGGQMTNAGTMVVAGPLRFNGTGWLLVNQAGGW